MGARLSAHAAVSTGGTVRAADTTRTTAERRSSNGIGRGRTSVERAGELVA
jgi:hypothetical protein